MLLSGAGSCQSKRQFQGNHVKGFALIPLALVQPRLGKDSHFSSPAANDVN